ncbi:hypothetical protein [Maribellus mangrovi]|uniref:hypothetical protein n=1 Tax=Maribellus mangrovi TaxID=3133146 RepID=UPI0030ED199D
MSLEEFQNHIQRFEELEEHYKQLYSGFSKKIALALTELVFLHWDKRVKDRRKIEEELLELGHDFARKIWDEFDHVHWLNSNGGKMAELSEVPKPNDAREKAKSRLGKLKKQLPEDYHSELEQSFWEDYEREFKDVLFTYAVYKKMKEVFTEFYIDDILEFESHILRYFDRGLYLMCTCPCVQKVYLLL